MNARYPALDALAELSTALEQNGAAVFSAPPGSGKTTVLAPNLLDAEWLDGKKILMLEPRRVAAKAAAFRIAALLNCEVGGKVGYAVRGERRASTHTRLEIVTEGILVRRLQRDPELAGVGLVIFDEFHERSMVCDLSLALTLDARRNLRPDLRILVMSATIDSSRIAALLGAPQVSAAGKMFNVENRYLRPPTDRRELPAFAAGAALELMRSEPGGCLVFLPGAFEIDTAADKARIAAPPDLDVRRLYAALDRDEQETALLPSPSGRRKLVFATNIAETSLTIEDVRMVVDSGFERTPRFDPSSGLTRLETARISRASAAQRAGRAGRLAPGVCLRLWSAFDEDAMAEFSTPEILAAELSGLALELTVWGTPPEELTWLDQPPAPALAAARELLNELALTEKNGRPTSDGRAAAMLPVHPRLGAMLVAAGRAGLAPLAAELAALIEERSGDSVTDLAELVGRCRRKPPYLFRTVRDQLLNILNIGYRECDPFETGSLLALAYPDRIAKRRAPDSENYLTSSGRGARVPEHDPLKRFEFLAVATLDGAGRDAAIRLAAGLDVADLQAKFPERFTTVITSGFDRGREAAFAVRQTRLGSIVISETPLAEVPPEPLLAAVREYGLRVLDWTPKATSLRERVRFAPGFPDWSDEALLSSLKEWLLPHLGRTRSFAQLAKIDLFTVLRDFLGYAKFAELESVCPEYFTTPAGSRLRIDYSGDAPKLAAKVQEFYGCKTHPRAGGRPLVMELLSPAMRPVQVTSDLPGFWRGSWELVKKDMKSRYPKHLWPDDPANESPTSRTIKKHRNG
ncbi:MAG: ATP-dependent helicase HrpB [Victivallaceae bacterium]|nr:ATP-dependent helicase HrpB [Victivallaceae bacterium]